MIDLVFLVVQSLKISGIVYSLIIYGLCLWSRCLQFNTTVQYSTRDFVGEHCSLLNTVSQSFPTDETITIYEVETGLISDLDQIPPLGCFGFRYLSKLSRKDFKLSSKNQVGVFLGFATLKKSTSGSILIMMIGDRHFVVAKDTVGFHLQ